MNILLAYPEFPDTFWSFKHALRFIRKKASLPPLGLLTVASMLPPDWPKRLVDLNVTALTDADLAWADCVLVSAMAVQRESAEQIISRCRKAGVRIVAGGPLFTAQPELFPDVDHLVLNEAELTLPPFLEDLAAGRAKHVYTTPEYADMRASPAPMWQLLDLGSYATMSVQYTRGCPYDCEFCNVTTLLGHRPRSKSAEQIIGELDSLYDLGWHQNVFFVDDNLIGNKKRLRAELLPALIEWRRRKPGMAFNTEASINLADDADLMRELVEAGFDAVFVGIETTNEDALAECNKKLNQGRDMVADVRRMQRAGLQVQGGFIVGFDADTPSTLHRVMDFIQAAGIVTAMVGLLQALPGTRLYDRLKKAGRLVDRNSGDNVDGTTNIIPASDGGSVRDGYKDGMRMLYSPKTYYRRVRTFLREYRLPRFEVPWDVRLFFRQSWAFVMSALKLGIAGRERIEYWKLLVWTVFRRPRSFGLAVTFAIYGYHFRRTCEAHLV